MKFGQRTSNALNRPRGYADSLSALKDLLFAYHKGDISSSVSGQANIVLKDWGMG